MYSYKGKIYATLNDVIDAIDSYEDIEILREQHNYFLNEIYGNIEIAGNFYQTAQVLNEVNPIAYKKSLLNHMNRFLENLRESTEDEILELLKDIGIEIEIIDKVEKTTEENQIKTNSL